MAGMAFRAIAGIAFRFIAGIALRAIAGMAFLAMAGIAFRSIAGIALRAIAGIAFRSMAGIAFRGAFHTSDSADLRHQISLTFFTSLKIRNINDCRLWRGAYGGQGRGEDTKDRKKLHDGAGTENSLQMYFWEIRNGVGLCLKTTDRRFGKAFMFFTCQVMLAFSYCEPGLFLSATPSL